MTIWENMGKPWKTAALDDVPVPLPGEDITGNWDFNSDFNQTRGPPPAETNLDFGGWVWDGCGALGQGLTPPTMATKAHLRSENR